MIIPDETFRPAWWAAGAHAQTILGRFLRKSRRLDFERVRLDTEDGDFMDIDLCRPTGVRADAPLVILFHGLEGSSHAPYMGSLAAAAQDAGWCTALINFRGCSREKSGRSHAAESNRLALTYHSGKTEDVSHVFDYLRAREGVRPFYAAGFSIGGNVLLKWLAEEGPDAGRLIAKAAAVSVPYDIMKSVELLDFGFNQAVYTRSLLSTLKVKALEKARRFPGSVDVERVRACRTFRVFDREVTARLNGFRDEIHYWTTVSSGPRLAEIRMPTLLIHAADDPFFPADLLPIETIRKSPYLKLVLTGKGGHLGFLTGALPWRPEPWLENKIVSFFRNEFE